MVPPCVNMGGMGLTCRVQLVILPLEGSLYHTEQAINNILIIKKFVTSVTPILDALLPARSTLLCHIRATCSQDVMVPIYNLISTVIDENATFVKKPLDLRHQRTYAVKVVQSHSWIHQAWC